MANKIQFRRGQKANLPTLSLGEPALCTDTNEVFIGTSGGNKSLVPVTSVNGKTGAVTLTASDIGAVESFVYNCTGTADSTAIANIVNKFFNTGTAMSMKLTVTGTMGVAFTTSYYAMLINATNMRGAVCYLDFSDCNIPAITEISKDFLYVQSATARVDVTGLVVTTSRYGINTTGNYNAFSNSTISCQSVVITGDNNSFSNCTINGGSAGTSTSVAINGNNNTFTNCKINSISTSGVSSNSQSGISISSTSDNNSFSNCTISNTIQNGSSYGAAISGTNSSFNNCMFSSYSGTSGSDCIRIITGANNNTFTNCTLNSSSNSETSTCVGVYILNEKNNAFGNCIISGTNNRTTNTASTRGIHISSDDNLLSNCTINGSSLGTASGTNYGVMLSGNNNLLSNCTINGSSSGTSNASNGIYALSGNNNAFSNCTISGSSKSTTSGIGVQLIADGVIIFVACRIVGTYRGVRASSSNTSAIARLIGCTIKGLGGEYDVQQVSVVSTMSWYIMGCTFAYSAIYVNGSQITASTNTANEYLYMPAYANMFSRIFS